MSEFSPFNDTLAGLIATLTATERRTMAAEIARRLRASQQRRIRAQQAPDGTPYTARKPQQVRGKRGRVRRAMFAKLRTNRYMLAKADPDAATVTFAGRVQRIAQVHQYGLKDKPNRHSAEVQYEARPLLGFTDEDKKIVEEVLLSHLKN